MEHVSTTEARPMLEYAPVQTGQPGQKVLHPPMLGWWGMIPAGIYMVLYGILGWPLAMARAGDWNYKMGWYLGGYAGGVVWPLLLAWIFYRIFRRSRLAALLTFSIVTGLFCMSVVLQAVTLHLVKTGVLRGSMAAAVSPTGTPGGAPTVASTPASSTIPPTPVATKDFFKVLECEVPAGWVKQKPEEEKTLALMVLLGEQAGSLQGLMQINVMKQVSPTARQSAQGLVKLNKGARVLPEAVTIDGVEGVQVEMPVGDLNQPRHVVMVNRKGKLYLLVSAAGREVDISGAFGQVVKSWRWVD